MRITGDPERIAKWTIEGNRIRWNGDVDMRVLAAEAHLSITERKWRRNDGCAKEYERSAIEQNRHHEWKTTMRMKENDVSRGTRHKLGNYEWPLIERNVTWSEFRRLTNVHAWGCMIQEEMREAANVTKEEMGDKIRRKQGATSGAEIRTYRIDIDMIYHQLRKRVKLIECQNRAWIGSEINTYFEWEPVGMMTKEEIKEIGANDREASGRWLGDRIDRSEFFASQRQERGILEMLRKSQRLHERENGSETFKGGRYENVTFRAVRERVRHFPVEV